MTAKSDVKMDDAPVYRADAELPDQQPPAYTPSPALTPRASFKQQNPIVNEATDKPSAPTAPIPAQAQVQPQAPAPTPSTKQPSTFNRKFHSITSMAGWPLNKAANVIGAEGWWPTSVEKECSKAARILHSFTNLNTAEPPKRNGPMHPTGMTKKSMVKIPDSVLQNCAGLAIFNVIRAGAVHASLAAGSGVVVSRRPDGSWSPPSSFVVSTVGAGFALGLDVYDCVCVLNTPAQVNAFASPRVSLGGDASIAIGPVGTGGSVDAAVSKTARPMWSYMKSRGLWAGVQIDGTIIVSRADANSVFYNERGISAKKILRGDVAWPAAGKPLREVLRAIDGRVDFDRTVVQEVGRMASPGDVVVAQDKRDDQNPFSDSARDETLLNEKERLARAGY